MKCIAVCRQRKVAIAQKQPLIINGAGHCDGASQDCKTDTMQRLLRTQSTRHMQSRFDAEGKNVRPEEEKSSGANFDLAGWMKMEVSPTLSPRSTLKSYYFKFSHERARMWYHDKETSVMCTGTVEL